MTLARAFTPHRDFAPLDAEAPIVEEFPDIPMIEEAEAEARLERAVEEARAAAFAEGEAAGRAAAEQALQAGLSAGLKTIEGQLDELLAKETAVLREVEVRAARLILSIAQKLITDLSDTEAEKFAAAVARRAVEAAKGAPSVEIRASEELAPILSDSLSGPLAAALQSGRAAITPDPSLDRASVHASWNHGSVAFDPSAMESAINKIVADALAKLEDGDVSAISQEKADETASQ